MAKHQERPTPATPAKAAAPQRRRRRAPRKRAGMRTISITNLEQLRTQIGAFRQRVHQQLQRSLEAERFLTALDHGVGRFGDAIVLGPGRSRLRRRRMR